MKIVQNLRLGKHKSILTWEIKTGIESHRKVGNYVKNVQIIKLYNYSSSLSPKRVTSLFSLPYDFIKIY